LIKQALTPHREKILLALARPDTPTVPMGDSSPLKDNPTPLGRYTPSVETIRSNRTQEAAHKFRRQRKRNRDAATRLAKNPISKDTIYKHGAKSSLPIKLKTKTKKTETKTETKPKQFSRPVREENLIKKMKIVQSEQLSLWSRITQYFSDLFDSFSIKLINRFGSRSGKDSITHHHGFGS